MNAVNIKIGDDTETNIESMEFEDATTSGTYYTFTSGIAETKDVSITSATARTIDHTAGYVMEAVNITVDIADWDGSYQ